MSDIMLDNDTEVIDDLVLTEDQLYFNNTFNLKALNDTLEKLSVINFWNLYQAQRSRVKMEKFQIPFNEFLPTNRLAGEKKKVYFPKRYVAYIDYTFIDPELRTKYRNSEFYNVAVNQETVTSNPLIFRHNYMVFIDGEFIFTTEIYPIESKTAIIIDMATNTNEHGISYQQFKEYKDNNPMVDIVLLPNYYTSNIKTNKYILEQYNYEVPIANIPHSENFNENTICFVNTLDDIARRYYDDKLKIIDNKVIIDSNIQPGGSSYRFCFITFNNLYKYMDLSYDEPYFQLDTKMPCPKEQMITFIKDEKGRYKFTNSINIDLFYPNIYKLNGLSEGDSVRLFILQDEEELSQSEKYMNEISKYEEYIELLPKYKDNSIPKILKTYQPSSYVYSIEGYNSSMYVPSTMNYKVQKLHKTIYENPWALVTYLDLLNLPTDKFYLDMEKIELDYRIRQDTYSEELDTGISNIEFKEDHYVFAMNRHFVDTRSYGFRIFIDGYFQCDNMYYVLSGPNYYYIYIPTSKITPTTVIEIERYKLFSFEQSSSTDDLNIPLLELDMSDGKRVGYSREIYLVDERGYYLNKETDFKIDVMYKFAEAGKKWTTLPTGRNIPIDNKVRIYLLNEKYLGKKIKVGITRTMAMTTGDIYHDTDNDDNDLNIYEYTELRMTNQGGYDIGGYRVFNNGKLLLPMQYFTSISKYQGSDDIIRTSCKLYDGDRFTVDRVPARFRVIYYQYEIDEDNKKGYVDLDGKVPLPISLKWYDIYVNGIKLHKKNIEIITPTKFYIQGVDSRKHLMIVVRNRDPEVFKLATHNPETDTRDYNNTIMDELMEEIGGLKDIIDNTKSVIDPNDETREIASEICRNLDALIFFYQYFMYTFINANKKQITQEIKEAFPTLINEQGIMEIDPNAGCIKSPEIGGYIIKLIECNTINERSIDMFTDENVSYDGLGTLQDRFAIRPLNTDNYEFGLPQEFMCDPETGEPAIVNDDGTVTTVSTIFRVKNFIESFSNNIMLYGMGKSDIYQITFDDEFKVKVYENNTNILTENIETPSNISKFAIGLDMTFLNKVGDSKMLKVADVNPTVTIEYMDGDVRKVETHAFNRLSNYIFEANNNIVTLVSIKCEGIPTNIKTFIHSLLIAF